MDRISPAAFTRGYTLIELMIVLVIVATSLSLGTPSMQKLVHDNRVSTEIRRLLGAINLARGEAVMRNTPVSLCPSAMAVTGEAKCSGVYADGWIVFSNPDRDADVDAPAEEVLQVYEGIPPGYDLTNRAGTRAAAGVISYFPDGSSYSNQTLLLCPPRSQRAESLAIVINIVGRARLAKGWGQCAPT